MFLFQFVTLEKNAWVTEFTPLVKMSKNGQLYGKDKHFFPLHGEVYLRKSVYLHKITDCIVK